MKKLPIFSLLILLTLQSGWGDSLGYSERHVVRKLPTRPWLWSSSFDLTGTEGDSVTNWNGWVNTTGGTNWRQPVLVHDLNGRKALGFYGTNVMTSEHPLPATCNSNVTIFIVVQCSDTATGNIIGRNNITSYGQIKLNAGAASYPARSGFFTFRQVYDGPFNELNMPRLDWPVDPNTNQSIYVIGVRYNVTNTAADGPLGHGQWHSINSSVIPHTRTNFLDWGGTPLAIGMLATGSLGAPFRGLVSEVIVYTNALNINEYQEAMNFLVKEHTKPPEKFIYWGSDSIFGGADMGPEEKNISPGAYKVILAAPDAIVFFNNGTTRTIEMETLNSLAIPPLTDDLLAARGQYAALWTIGSDDLFAGSNAVVTAERYFRLLDTMRDRGWRTYAATLIPREPNGITGAQFETDRQTFNKLVRDNWPLFADGLIDLTGVPWLSYSEAYTNATYFKQSVTNVGSPNGWASSLLSKFIVASIQRSASSIGGTNQSNPTLYRTLNANGTLLTLEAIDDGALLKRSGTSIVGALSDFTIQASAPAVSSEIGTPGMIRYDSFYVYICIATNTWRRSALCPW